MGYFVKDWQKYDGAASEESFEDAMRFDERIKQAVGALTDAVGRMLFPIFCSTNRVAVPGIMEKHFPRPSKRGDELAWRISAWSSYVHIYKNCLFYFEISTKSNTCVGKLLPVNYVNVCPACHGAGYLMPMMPTDRVIDTEKLPLVPLEEIPNGVHDADSLIANTIDRIHGEGDFDDALRLVEDDLQRLGKSILNCRIEVDSKLRVAGKPFAVARLDTISLMPCMTWEGIPYSSRHEYLKSKREKGIPCVEPRVQYVEPCIQCSGKGSEENTGQ